VLAADRNLLRVLLLPLGWRTAPASAAAAITRSSARGAPGPPADRERQQVDGGRAAAAAAVHALEPGSRRPRRRRPRGAAGGGCVGVRGRRVVRECGGRQRLCGGAQQPVLVQAAPALGAVQQPLLPPQRFLVAGGRLRQPALCLERLGADGKPVAWCGVVWCGVVWCGVVWCGVVWCGVVWCVVWCGAVL
jgi:hypothetical protein